MAQTKPAVFSLNALIAVLSVVLLILLGALISRIMTPRVEPERMGNPEEWRLIAQAIQVEVRNGCGVPGVASRFTDRLRRYGFDVVESGNFETFDIPRTLVIDRSGNLEHARKVATALGIPYDQIIQEISPDFFLDATVVIGADFPNLNFSK
jgi:hypothetical protein